MMTIKFKGYVEYLPHEWKHMELFEKDEWKKTFEADIPDLQLVIASDEQLRQHARDNGARGRVHCTIVFALGTYYHANIDV